MPTLRNSLTDNSAKDNTGDAINGSEVDANPQLIANVLDGTTSTTLGQAGALTFNGAYTTPLVVGTARIWYDSTNATLRIKHGSNPSSATDGNMLIESA